MPGFGRTLAGLRAMSAAMDKVRSKAAETRTAVADTRAAVDEAKGQLSELDRLYSLSKETQNNFSKDFELDMQRVRLGIITLSDLQTKWGDASIATENGFQTIRDAFEGADFGQYQQKIQDLITNISDGSAKIGDIIAFLKENAGDLAKGLINVLDLFKAGKASLEDVQRVLDSTKQAFPGSDSDALAEAIRNALLGGDLGGEV